jgi:WD40 repeat protein
MPRRISRILIHCMVRNRLSSALLIVVLLAACGNAQPADSSTPQPVPRQTMVSTATITAPTEAAVSPVADTPQTVTQTAPTVHAPAGKPTTIDSIASLKTIAVLGHGVPYAIALNDDRSMLAAGGTAGVWLYDYPTLSPIRRLASDAPSINAVAWSADGQRVAGLGATTQQGSDTVWIWNAATGDVLHVLDDSPDMGRTLAWSPDGAKLAAGGFAAVRVWDTQTGNLLQTFEGLTPSTAVVWSPDGTLLAASEAIGSNRVYVWDPTGQSQERILELPSSGAGISGGAYSLAWSPDGAYLAAGGLDRLILWDTGTWTSLPVEGEASHALAWSPDGQKLAWGNQAGKVGQLRLQDGDWVAQNLGWHRGIVSSLAWISDSDVLLSGSFGMAGNPDATIKTWDVNEAKEITSTRLVDHVPLWTMDWSPDGNTLAAVEKTGTVWLWDVDARAEIGQWPDTAGRVTSFAWSPDGRLAATGNNEGRLQLWNASSRDMTADLDAGTDPIVNLGWSPNGQALATWSADGQLRLWDTATGSQRTRMAAGTPVGWNSLAWSPDGNSLALGTGANILILDGQTGESIGTLAGESEEVTSVAWSPDSAHIVSGGTDGAIRVWNASNQRLEQSVPDPHGGALDLAWSPRGDLLAAANADGSLSAVRTDTWKQAANWTSTPAGLNSVEWSPGGDVLVWGGSGGVVLVMGVPGKE